MSRWVVKYEWYVLAKRQQSALLSKSDCKRQQSKKLLSKSACKRQQSNRLLSKSSCLVLKFWLILCTIEVSILSKISADKDENKILSNLSIVTLQLICVVRWLTMKYERQNMSQNQVKFIKSEFGGWRISGFESLQTGSTNTELVCQVLLAGGFARTKTTNTASLD